MIRDMRYAGAQAQNEKRTSEAEKDFSEAVNRVYEKYGTDLSAFYRDVKKSITLEKCTDSKPQKRGSAD